MTGFSRRDLATLAAILRTAARAEIMPRFRNLAAAEVRHKTGPLDLVTTADEAAERHITAALHREFPGCTVLGEEAAAANPAILNTYATADLAFVVDPVDGTSNFAAGLPLFGCMAAAIQRGEVIAAAIHDPVGDDTALALRGEGAWTETASGTCHPLRVATPVPPAQMTGAASWRYLPETLRTRVCTRLPRLGATWDYRCAAHEYRMLAAGHCHYLLFWRLMPWDHAPGWLLHHEAGGFSAQFDTTPYTPTVTKGGLICTPDEPSFHALRDVLLNE